MTMMVQSYKGRSKSDIDESVDRTVARCNDAFSFTKKSVAAAKREAWRRWRETGDPSVLHRTVKEHLRPGQKDLVPPPAWRVAEEKRFKKLLATADAWVLLARPKDETAHSVVIEACKDYNAMFVRVCDLIDTGKFLSIHSGPIFIKGEKAAP